MDHGVVTEDAAAQSSSQLNYC